MSLASSQSPPKGPPRAEVTVTVRRIESRLGDIAYYGLAFDPPPLPPPASSGEVPLLFRRYTDFLLLDAALRRTFPKSAVLDALRLPPRHLPALLYSRSALAARRAPVLARYLSTVMSNPELFGSQYLRRTFLDLVEDSGAASPACPAGLSVRQASGATTLTQSGWLDRLAAMRRAVVQCRQAALDCDALLARGETLLAYRNVGLASQEVDRLLGQADSLDAELAAEAECQTISSQEAARRRNQLLDCRQKLVELSNRFLSDSPEALRMARAASESSADGDRHGGALASRATLNACATNSSKLKRSESGPSWIPLGMHESTAGSSSVNSSGSSNSMYSAIGSVASVNKRVLGRPAANADTHTSSEKTKSKLSGCSQTRQGNYLSDDDSDNLWMECENQPQTTSGVRPIPCSKDMPESKILQLQQETLTQQDSDLRSLSMSVARSKNIANQLNEELELQNTETLSDLKAKIDSGISKVTRATKKASSFV